MIRVILIDIDNTLLDFDAYVRHSMKKGFEKYQLKPYEEGMYAVFRQINTGLWKQIEKGEITFHDLEMTRWNKIFDALGIDFDGVRFERFFRRELFDNAIPMPGALQALAYLKERFLLCVASNGPLEQQLNRLRVGGMLDYFTHTFISEQVGASKPTEEFYGYCLSVINQHSDTPILPEEVVMIGDSVSADMAGGRQNGLKTCWFTPDVSAQKPPEADFVLAGWDKITELF